MVYSIEKQDRLTVISHQIPTGASFKDSVYNGLVKGDPSAKYPKRLSCEFLYDTCGSEIFEEITMLNEYYLTRCEASILEENSLKVAQEFVNKDPIIIELGSGSSTKTKYIIEAFISTFGKCWYMPIDISRSMLVESSEKLAKEYGSKITITAQHGTYNQAMEYIHQQYSSQSKLIMFLGSSLGNFHRPDAISFIQSLTKCMNPMDKLLLGVDLRKKKEILEPAYDDALGVTAKFNLNLLKRINNELNGNFDIESFQHEAKYDEIDGYIRMFLKSKKDQEVYIGAINRTISFKENEVIHTENSVKYSLLELDTLAYASGLFIEHFWMDKDEKFSLSLMSPLVTKSPKYYQQILSNGWSFSDKIFGLLTKEAFYQKPIELRHPFIFYLGHLPAFANNQISNFLLQQKSKYSYYDNIFERGIDPDVITKKCHDHSVVPSDWPSIEEIIKYRGHVRQVAMETIEELLKDKKNIMAIKGRVYHMVAEHDFMHGETLLYMYQNLPKKFKNIPSSEVTNYRFGSSNVTKKSITIPDGSALVGARYHEIEFGWDNEFSTTEYQVPSFTIDNLPVTNNEYLKFFLAGGYDDPKYWSEKAWNWKKSVNLKHPHFWAWNSTARQFNVTTIFGDTFPFEQAGNWPVFVSHCEAVAYCKWSGKRLPTEPEWVRAAYGKVSMSGDEEIRMNQYPWGTDSPKGGYHGNFNLFSLAPTPVGSFPNGKSEFGMYDTIGNGWEWTSTVFEKLKNYENYIPSYQGYSSDFFDGEHYVMLGGSFATAEPMIRKSFRNWFQDVYQFTFTTFRCVNL